MTDYYTCDDCGGYTLTCGCDERHKAERKAYRAEEARKDAAAVYVVSSYFDEHDAAFEPFQRLLKLASHSILQHKRFAEGGT